MGNLTTSSEGGDVKRLSAAAGYRANGVVVDKSPDINTEDWRTRALIDTAALRDNLALARRLAPGCGVMAVIKANGYGHRMELITREIAAQVDAFAVATLQEGIDCRIANPSVAVTVLSGLQQPSSLALCERYRLDPVAHTFEHVEWLEQYGGAPLRPWLKIDTGMNRLGIEPQQAGEAIARLRRNRQVQSIRLMSHLANADDTEDDYSSVQLKRFRRCTDQYQLERSLANSAAVMKWPQTHFQWVRPGIMLYGGSPLSGCHGPELGLKPVMQLEARLLSIKTVAAGQPVGYGGTFVTSAPTRVGVVGFGYGDGYPRVVSRSAAVLIGGVRAPVIGRVAMDMTTVDLSRCAEAAIGQKVVIWGSGLSVDEVANWAGTISYQLLCRVSERVPRVIAKTGPKTGPEQINGET